MRGEKLVERPCAASRNENINLSAKQLQPITSNITAKFKEENKKI